MQEMPKLTVVVVGKRHHVRFFPTSAQNADKSGNCRAGTVVDTDISHPVEFDFYLQSHGGLLGTSRPAHYSVLWVRHTNMFVWLYLRPSTVWMKMASPATPSSNCHLLSVTFMLAQPDLFLFPPPFTVSPAKAICCKLLTSM